MKILLGIIFLLGCFSGLAYAGTKIVWDRNADDATAYNVYACLTKGCAASKTPALVKATVTQTQVGTLPQWVYPLNTEGQVCVTSKDAAGNESACSVAVNFDGAAPAVPQNVIEQ